jgi:hypothetical protein
VLAIPDPANTVPVEGHSVAPLDVALTDEVRVQAPLHAAIDFQDVFKKAELDAIGAGIPMCPSRHNRGIHHPAPGAVIDRSAVGAMRSPNEIGSGYQSARRSFDWLYCQSCPSNFGQPG